MGVAAGGIIRQYVCGQAGATEAPSNSHPRPRGVNDGALAAWVGSDAFLAVDVVAGVNDGDSTFRAFLELKM